MPQGGAGRGEGGSPLERTSEALVGGIVHSGGGGGGGYGAGGAAASDVGDDGLCHPVHLPVCHIQLLGAEAHLRRLGVSSAPLSRDVWSLSQELQVEHRRSLVFCLFGPSSLLTTWFCGASLCSVQR